MKNCIRCGCVMQDEDIFCRKCGFEFVENNVTLQKTDVSGDMPRQQNSIVPQTPINISSPPVKYCTHCRQPLTMSAQYCSRCGNNQPPYHTQNLDSGNSTNQSRGIGTGGGVVLMCLGIIGAIIVYMQIQSDKSFRGWNEEIYTYDLSHLCDHEIGMIAFLLTAIVFAFIGLGIIISNNKSK